MIIEVDERSPVPPYEQIRAQIATMVVSGVLLTDHRLPPIRQLASDLGLSNGTVARAYQELERGGWVATRGRRGTIVQANHQTASDFEEDLTQAARAFVVRAVQLGVSPHVALEAVRSALERKAPLT